MKKIKEKEEKIENNNNNKPSTHCKRQKPTFITLLKCDWSPSLNRLIKTIAGKFITKVINKLSKRTWKRLLLFAVPYGMPMYCKILPSALVIPLTMPCSISTSGAGSSTKFTANSVNNTRFFLYFIVLLFIRQIQNTELYFKILYYLTFYSYAHI